MSIIVGQAVRNEDFWERKYELEDIWDAIESGSHILLSAPRRVGKTSILYRVQDEPKENYIALYIDTESADSQNEFWEKLFHALMSEEFMGKLKHFRKKHTYKLKTIRFKKISALGVEFDDGKVVNYKEAFKALVEDLDDDKKIIIMLDEFAQTIENIIKYEDKQNALSLLKSHREMRQDNKISAKVTFLYAGSIGLESVVAKLDATKHINDLNNIKIPPLSIEEAQKFTEKLCSNNTINMSKEVIDYLLEKVEWLIPFYIQLIVQEVKKISRREPHITRESINKALDNAIEHRNYFENWQSKLKEAFKNKEYLFAKEVLNKISDLDTLTSQKIANIATKHEVEAYKEILKALVYDGYINNNDNPKIYRFNSPILRMWWYKNVAN
ncbi:MAG: ATP-binding protein [Campylobacterota bacterium]|nr:ATP-binding protein [Campylobacterota bacterium]